jgi:hypothetical protein
MNAQQKAQILRANGYRHFARGIFAKHEWCLGFDLIVRGESFAQTTTTAYEHYEQSQAQAANDAAGEAEYNEVIEEAKSELQLKLEKRLGKAQGTLSALQEVNLAMIPQVIAKNEELRQQLADAQAENARMGKVFEFLHKKVQQRYADAKSMATKASMGGHSENERFYGGIEDELGILLGSFDNVREIFTSAPTPPAPKKPVPVSCRVNWNGRGLSSGSYPVLGYSPEKQSYILNISTDNTKVMPKTVKMADCERAS